VPVIVPYSCPVGQIYKCKAQRTYKVYKNQQSIICLCITLFTKWTWIWNNSRYIATTEDMSKRHKHELLGSLIYASIPST